MKKTLSLVFCALLTTALFAQDNPTSDKKTINLSNRVNDYVLLQLGITSWSGMPDTINDAGISKSLNIYLMKDFPFKTNPHVSAAIGIGIGSDHMLFKETYIGIKDRTSEIFFTNQVDTNHFKKTKLATTYLELPVEFRYSANPAGRGFKFALGAKVGTMINAHTRNTKFQDKDDHLLIDYMMKESSKRFFNSNRLSLMGRIGYGHFSIYSSYQITALFKDGQGPVVRPFSVGLTISGL